MTAVEWLANEIKDLIPNDIGSQLKFKNKVKKAKEMEEKQRQEDTNHGYSEGYDDGINGEEPMKPVLKSE